MANEDTLGPHSLGVVRRNIARADAAAGPAGSMETTSGLARMAA